MGRRACMRTNQRVQTPLTSPFLHRAKMPDVVAPPGHQRVALGITATVPYTVLAEGELMLRIHQCRRGMRMTAIDPPGSQHAVIDDLLVLCRADRPPDLVGKLLANDAALPHPASPHDGRHDQ